MNEFLKAVEELAEAAYKADTEMQPAQPGFLTVSNATWVNVSHALDAYKDVLLANRDVALCLGLLKKT